MEDQEMPFIDHLEQLRKHLIRSAIVILVLAVAAFATADFVFDQILLAPSKPNFWTYRQMCALAERFNIKALCIGTDLTINPITLKLTSQIGTHISSSIIVGLIVAFPYVVWEIWRFVQPALYPTERRATVGVIGAITLLFALGTGFGYFIITPISITFLATYKISESINPTDQFLLDDYIGMVTMLTLACALMFQLPVVCFFLTKMGLISSKLMKAYRRHSIVIVIIIAAIVTPSVDMFSQLIIAFPLILLYEMSIGVAAYIERKERQQEKESAISLTKPKLDQLQ